MEHGRQHAVGQQHASAAKVPHQVERRNRSVSCPTHGFERASEGDVVDVMARGTGHRTILPPPGHAAVDKLRVAGETHFGAKTEPLRHPGSESLHEAVSLIDQPKYEVHAGRIFQIHSHGPSAPVHQIHVGLGTRGVRRPVSSVDTHDVRSGIGEHHPCERCRAETSQLDDLDAFQRSAHSDPPLTSPLGYVRALRTSPQRS